MNNFFMRVTILSAIFSLFLSLNSACAEKTTVSEIVKELGPLESTVIKGPHERYLINMGTIHNIKKGNLWTVYSTGEQVIEPITGKKLGVLPVPIAICKVTRVEKHFSEISVKCFKKSCSIKSGITAKRYCEIKTMFYDVNGSSFRLYELIRANLPSLDWQGYQSIENSADVTQLPEGVVIVADKGRVTIWSGGEILSIHDEMTSARSLPQPALTQSTPPVTETKEIDSKQKTVTSAPGIMIPGLSTNLKIENYEAVTSIDHIVDSVGIIESDRAKTPYFIYLSNKTLYALAVETGKSYQYAYKGFGDMVNMSLGPNGLIALNIYIQGEGMNSRILKFSTRGFTVLTKDIEYILEFLDMNGNGINESLVGQDFDAESFFGSGVFRLAVDDSGRITQHDSMDTPKGFNLLGAIMADLDKNKIKETAYYNPGGKLVVYEANKQKWESPSRFDPIKIMLIDDIVNESNAPRDVPVWPQSALFNEDHVLFAVVPSNQTGIWSIVGGRSKNGGLGVLCPSNGTYAFRLLTTKFQGPVQSIFMYDNELYIAVVEGNTFTGQGKTHIISVPMNVLKKSIK
ncbi:MAG: hypothetical protein JRF31_05160 [Deltaproteobacteria bacterium]|nr:hypothetical protein [Deltaproteobacteria bacterium]MBW2089578.1 hypothetical protein [Deltaproteobacteria bacterium]MBW2320236.1 hypothetical protein [Deltaproteobacteria bacterium]